MCSPLATPLMANELGLNGNNEYYRYKQAEKEGFSILFPDKLYSTLSAKELERAAKDAVSSLDSQNRNQIVDCFAKSLSSRETHSLRFRYAPLQNRRGHEYWSNLVQRIIDFAKLGATIEEHTEHPEDIAGESEISVDKADFLRFLEDVERCIAQAEALWVRVGEGKLPVWTASMLTETQLQTAQSMVNTEMLLNPSWFVDTRLSASMTADNAPYWAELQFWAGHLQNFISNAAWPVFNLKTSIIHAPLLTQMLMKDSTKHPRTTTVFNVPFVAAVAATLAHRCCETSPCIEEIRSSVKKQISSSTIILQKHEKTYRDQPLIQEISTRMEIIKDWAPKCNDVVSFGHMMSWIKVQHVLCVRLYIYDSTILQLFAYTCERIRINGNKLPPTLDEPFNDQRVSPFLFINGRPTTLVECKTGVERWSDPAGMLENLKLTQHIFKARYKPTLTQSIIESKGYVTRDMVERLGNRPLEDTLNWELECPDLDHLEGAVISAARIVVEGNSANAGSHAEVWRHLRFHVLYNLKEEMKFFSRFKKAYTYSAGKQ